MLLYELHVAVNNYHEEVRGGLGRADKSGFATLSKFNIPCA